MSRRNYVLASGRTIGEILDDPVKPAATPAEFNEMLDVYDADEPDLDPSIFTPNTNPNQNQENS